MVASLQRHLVSTKMAKNNRSVVEKDVIGFEGRRLPPGLVTWESPGDFGQLILQNCPGRRGTGTFWYWWILFLDGQKLSHVAPTRQGKSQKFCWNEYLIALGLTLVSLKRCMVLNRSLGLDSPVHPFQPGDAVCIRTWNFGTIQPKWKGPSQVLLVTYPALKVEGIKLRVHHMRVKPASTH